MRWVVALAVGVGLGLASAGHAQPSPNLVGEYAGSLGVDVIARFDGSTLTVTQVRSGPYRIGDVLARNLRPGPAANSLGTARTHRGTYYGTCHKPPNSTDPRAVASVSCLLDFSSPPSNPEMVEMYVGVVPGSLAGGGTAPFPSRAWTAATSSTLLEGIWDFRRASDGATGTFQFYADGNFVLRGDAYGDNPPRQFRGRWQLSGNRLTLTYDNGVVRIATFGNGEFTVSEANYTARRRTQ